MAAVCEPRPDDPERVAAQLVQQARATTHLSQRALAALAGVPQSTVARIEGGHMQPTLPLLYRILQAAGLKARTVLEPAADAVIGPPAALPAAPAYRPMTLVDLAGHLAGADDDQLRWRLIAEFLQEHRHEPIDVRAALLRGEPPATGDERWDVFVAALAEHLAGLDDRGTAAWTAQRRLDVFWFPFNTAAARVDAYVHAPAGFRRRGIFVAPQELGVA
jgi:transcriptional regulator with XRE-family HTH domain